MPAETRTAGTYPKEPDDTTPEGEEQVDSLEVGQTVRVDVTGNEMWRFGTVAEIVGDEITVKLLGHDGDVTVETDRVKFA